MRLIDADALEKKFKEMGLGEHSLVERLFADGVFAIIENAPTVDAVPVVRCKDCISYSSGACYSMLGLGGNVSQRDFCPYGGRSEVNETD